MKMEKCLLTKISISAMFPNPPGISTSAATSRPKNGLAEVVIYDKRRPWKYQEELLKAQDQAKKQKLGLWNASIR